MQAPLIRQAALVARQAGYRLTTVTPRHFSIALPRLATEARLGKGNKAAPKSQLLQKVESEIKGEAELEKETPNEDRIAAVKKQGVWQIEETDGSNLISLTRTYKGETIRVTFPCQNTDYGREALDDDANREDDEDNDEEANENEEEDGEEDDEAIDDEDVEEVSAVVTVEAPGKPLLVADINLDPTAMEVEGVRVLPAGTKTDSVTLRALDHYHGPDYSLLDPDVQEEFEKWFAERGISSELLGDHVADVKAWKEQKEYIRWLNDLKTFLKS